MRKAWRILVWFCGLLIFLAAFLVWQWQQLLTRFDLVDLHWDLHQLSWRSVHLDELRFTRVQTSERVHVSIKNLQLHWQWQGFIPVVRELVAQDLLVEIYPSGVSSPVTSSSFTLPADWHLSPYLPRVTRFNRVRLNLPCGAGRCDLQAQMQSTLAENILALEARLENVPTPVSVDVVYEVRNGLPHLRSTVRAQELARLTSVMALAETLTQPRWQGEAELAVQPPSAQWLEYLRQWQPFNPQQAEHFTQTLQASAAWQLELLPLLNSSGAVTDLASAVQWVRDHVHGEVELSFDAPTPFPLPQVGGISGQVLLTLASEPGRINRHEIDVDVQVAPVLMSESLAHYDVALDKLALKLVSRSEDDINLQMLPLALQVRTEGRQQLAAEAALVINSESLDIEIVQARVQLQAAEWHPLEKLALTDVSLDTRFNGGWRAGVLLYEQQEPALLRGNIASSSVQLHNSKLQVEQLQLQIDPRSWLTGQLDFKGDFSAAEVINEVLIPQAWQWQGTVQAADGRAGLAGTLHAASGLTLAHQLTIDDQRQWRLDWQLPDIFLLAGNSLQQLTPQWPPLLMLTRGRIGGHGWIAGSGEGDGLTSRLASDMSWRLQDVTGIYDTTAFQGASGQLRIALANNELTVSSQDVNIREVTRGVAAGPVAIKGHYRVNLETISANDDALSTGILVLDQVEAEFLGGAIRIPPVTVDLAKADQPLLIELANIDLGKLLEIHPSSELRGSGKLSGQIPLVWSPAGLRVAKGVVAAEEPGGRLQYQSQGATTMAAGSQGMKIVTDALNDFHYTLLRSEVNYEQDGTLLLGVRLEGSNPSVENGRAINFNITLEEDLPALITSLQLSGQISDVIKKRVQDKLQQRNAR